MSTLHGALRNTLETTQLVDPAAIADHITATLDSEQLAEAHRLALTYWVRSHMARDRQGPPEELIGSPASGPTPVREATAPPAPRKQNHKRGKAAMIRDWWTDFLNERVNVEGTWKLMGECTITDVQALAAQRRDLAAANAAAAAKYEALSALMESSGAGSVRDLDSSQVKALPAAA